MPYYFSYSKFLPNHKADSTKHYQLSPLRPRDGLSLWASIMPSMPTTLCSHSGCNANAGINGVCRLHKPKAKQHPDKQINQAQPAKLKRIDHRLSASQRGYDVRWRSARMLFLNDHPLCKHCQAKEIIRAADVVDHILPHRGNQELFWDQTNWQPLCYPCHSIKTTTVDNKLSDYDIAQLRLGGWGKK